VSESGIGVLLVEQHVEQVLDVSDRAYVMRRGEIVLEGSAAHVLERIDDLESTYLSAVGDPATNGSSAQSSDGGMNGEHI
jgi:branched-chain amino acid transport system ATP-binding protein